MRKNVFLLCLVAVAMMLPAVTVAQNNDIKLWSDGLLTWSDFTGVTIVKDVPSYMKVELTTTSKTINADGKTKVSLTANAVMHRNLSYADTAKCDAQRLRYHQLQFDMLEYFRRRLQNDINTGINEYETTQRIKKYEELYTERVKEMDVATTNGADEHKLQDWEYLVRRQLEDMGVPNVPEVSQGGFVYGIYGGVGAVFPTSELKDNFDGCAIFMIGLTGGYDRLRLKADIAFGQPSFNNSNIFNVKDTQGRPSQDNSHSYATYLGIGTTLGYNIFDSGRFSITPNIGGYWSNYSWDVNNLEWTKNDAGKDVTKVVSTVSKKLHNFNWMASVDFDIKFHAHATSMPFTMTGKREQFSSSIRISPFVARAKYNKCDPSVSGYHVGFTVCYVGLARALGY